MTRKQAKNPEAIEESSFITWGQNDPIPVQAFGEGLSAQQVSETLAYAYSPYGFSDIQPGVNARVPFTRDHYEYFRPEEATPTKYKDIIKRVEWAYATTPVVKNVIDLMADFGCKGVRPIHPNSKIQKYYEDWFEIVSGQVVSERFLNILFRLAVVYIQKSYVPLPDQEMPKGKDFTIRKGSKIPLRYSFYHPLTVTNILGDASTFLGKSIYTLEIPEELKSIIKSPKKEHQELLSSLPKDLINSVKNNKPFIIPNDELSVYTYKKDDWRSWAFPLIYPILNDIVILDKMKLADQTALDTLISKVRVWKLGDLDLKIVPGVKGMESFKNLLTNNPGGGTVDIIWNPAIDLLETSADANILGEAKYIPIYNSIYTGLGISQALAGDNKGGQTSTSISLKTFIERLEYGRNLLINFWKKEFKIVQEAKGFKEPAEIQFERPVLTDEVSARKLLLDLADRNIISYQTVRDRIGESSPVEERRIRREVRQRENGSMPQQGDPYHSPTLESDLKKIALQSGTVTPSEVGLDLKDKKPGEKAAEEIKAKLAPKIKPAGGLPTSKKPKGKSGMGRPKGMKDSTKRKAKTVKPFTGKTKASHINSFMIDSWAKSTLSKIHDKLLPEYLESLSKKTARSLTSAQFAQFEEITFSSLSKLEPMSTAVECSLVAEPIDEDLLKIKNDLVVGYVKVHGKEPEINELRDIQSTAYTIWCINKTEGSETENETI